MHASIRRFASALVAAAGLAVGIGASSASAVPFVSATLGITAIADNDYIISVNGHVEMSQADAQAACSHPGDPVDVELYGDDFGFDDLLISTSEFAAATMTCTTSASGMDYRVSLTRDGDVLNEDRPGEDELRALVTFLDIRTGTTTVAYSPLQLRRI